MRAIFNLSENDLLFVATMIAYKYDEPNEKLEQMKERIESNDESDIEINADLFVKGNDKKELVMAMAGMAVCSLCKDIIDE